MGPSGPDQTRAVESNSLHDSSSAPLRQQRQDRRTSLAGGRRDGRGVATGEASLQFCHRSREGVSTGVLVSWEDVADDGSGGRGRTWTDGSDVRLRRPAPPAGRWVSIGRFMLRSGVVMTHRQGTGSSRRADCRSGANPAGSWMRTRTRCPAGCALR